MYGLMMDKPLTITSIMQHADRNYPYSEIVSITVDSPRHSYNYADAFKQIRKLANALTAYGIKLGDRVGFMAWNDYRHFELYYAVSGIGSIMHTINPRLSYEQITYIINHSADRLIFVDLLNVSMLEKIKDDLQKVELFVVLTDEAHMPKTTLVNVQCYESFITNEKDEFDWSLLDEQTASSLYYTSGTMGNPKGVLYSHRSTVLHSLIIILPDVFNFSIREVILPIVPMFHVNTWSCLSAHE